MTAEPQTFANHKRIDPWFHYAGLGLGLVVFVLAGVHVCRGLGGINQLLISVLLLVILMRVRTYGLRVQDRVIRLEETLRMQVILPEALRSRIQELRTGQLVALRFASDGELAARMEETLKEGLTATAIKQRIQTWRPDNNLRV